MLLSPRQCSKFEYSIFEMFNIDKTFRFQTWSVDNTAQWG